MSYEKTQCPKCGQGFRFAPEHLGRKTRCKNCKEVIVIAVHSDPPVAHAAPVPADKQAVTAKPVSVAKKKTIPSAVTPQPAVPVAAAPIAKPAATPVAETKSESASPYESFVDEVMTGVGSTVQKVAALPQGTAESYLKTNSKLNFGKAKRDGDWATTFIFRGTNLAFFGFLLFGISMIGVSVAGVGSLLVPLTSPLCALIALTIGIVGSVMVMVGFAAKPGSAAVCGLVPALLFIAGGIWLGSRYFDGHWDIDSKTMAKAADHHRANEDNPNFMQRPFRANQPVPANPVEREIKRHFDDPFKQAEETHKRLVEQSRKRMEERNRQAREARRRMEEARAKAMNPPEPANQDLRIVAPPNQRGQRRDKDQPNNLVKPPPAQDTPDPFAGWNKTGDKEKPETADGDSIPFADYQKTFVKHLRLRSEMERHARDRFGIRSMTDFPKENLIGPMGGASTRRRFGTSMIAKTRSPVVGFLAIGDLRDMECRQLTPVFGRNETSSSVGKDGYVLAGLEAGFRDQKMIVVRGIYVRASGNKLDVNDRYEGEWIGSAQGIKDAIKIESDGPVPIGFRTTGVSAVESVSLIID